MRSSAVRLLASVVLVGALLPQTTSSAAPEKRVHVLKGVSTFTATTTSKTLVRFPKPVDLFDDFHLHYEGDGRVRGFILRKLGKYEQEGYRPVMESATIGQCKTRGCKSRKDDFTFIVCFCDSPKLTGTWELYVIADGAPVTLTFKSKNLTGRSRARVTDPVRTEIKTLDPRVHERNTDTVFSAGDYTKLKEADFGLMGLWTVGDPNAATAIGDCIYYDYSDYGYPTANPPEEVAFTPGCPTAYGDVYPYADPNGGRGGAIFTSASFCCPVGLGGWYATAAAVKRYGAVALWMDF